MHKTCTRLPGAIHSPDCREVERQAAQGEMTSRRCISLIKILPGRRAFVELRLTRAKHLLCAVSWVMYAAARLTYSCVRVWQGLKVLRFFVGCRYHSRNFLHTDDRKELCSCIRVLIPGMDYPTLLVNLRTSTSLSRCLKLLTTHHFLRR
ncbi:hypothetical protein K470DRAFT_35306 [Piedraia hortae CBS 480.64]|uniref:Uncharacterized protein n=1 Tax=Piedraia hortae CBS 480.64 TaxID=1314780 RepID=A0A6A7C2I4_9PEZI|nr:hypothetical protein K470DRAFT_35306 [Piedraia hortae CBS 480.64]